VAFKARSWTPPTPAALGLRMVLFPPVSRSRVAGFTLSGGIQENHSVDGVERNAEDAGLLLRRCYAAEEKERR